MVREYREVREIREFRGREHNIDTEFLKLPKLSYHDLNQPNTPTSCQYGTDTTNNKNAVNRQHSTYIPLTAIFVSGCIFPPYNRKLLYHHIPVVSILYATILDALEVIVHLLTSLTNLHTVVVCNVVIEVVESTDR